ncbi:MAG: zinc-ribbon domain-containing protein [Theionarchaea archaeon]|nr:zinc-ribbon domain-containing protein [Theionarchaea archaeon]
MSKIKIFSFVVTLLFILGTFSGSYKPSSVQGQGNAICGVLDLLVVSSCGSGSGSGSDGYPPHVSGGPFAVPAQVGYALQIRTCGGQRYNVRFCDMLSLFSGSMIKINNPKFGYYPGVCVDQVYGIVNWSSYEIISSCSDCESRPSSVEIWVDRGCENYYDHGDRVTVSFKVTSSASTAIVSIVNNTTDGRKKYIISNETVETNKTYGFEGTIECPGGKESVLIIATVVVNGHMIELRDECFFYIHDCPDPCRNVNCGTVCRGDDLWSQKCIDGSCFDDELIESNSLDCGYDPCSSHCTNGKKDCGEYGVDCGGGCSYEDSDYDGVEDCIDSCPDSRCSRVNARGCEIDTDGDGVMDCEDECPNEKGDPSNGGCPIALNLVLIMGCIGGIAAAGSMTLWGIKGRKPPSHSKTVRRISRTASRSSSGDSEIGRELYDMVAGGKSKLIAVRKISGKMAEGASKYAGEKLAEGASKYAGEKLAEGASKYAGEKLAEGASKYAGTKVAEGAVGTSVAASIAGKPGNVYCSNCGNELPADSNFCGQCGYRIQFSEIQKDQKKKNIGDTHILEEGEYQDMTRELSRHERRKMFFESLVKELEEKKRNRNS